MNEYLIIPMPTYNHFYDLPVYKMCREFRKNISTITKKYFPKTEEYHLKSQILSSSRSITANIAEGFGRFHHQENIQFCRQARGSLTETMEHDEYKKCPKEINGYIKYLRTAKEK